MSLSNSFLSGQSEDVDHCLLCDRAILRRDKVSIPNIQGWEAFVQKAQEWSVIDIPANDNCYRFRFVYLKVQNANTPFGKRHSSCRCIFYDQIKILRFIKRYGTVHQDPSTEMIADESRPIEEHKESRLTRSSSDHIKSFERKCVICQIIRPIESNPYNQGGLGRCEKSSSADRIIKAAFTNINIESSRFYKASKRIDLLLSGPSHDVFSADIYYHQSCYIKFTTSVQSSERKGKTDVDKEKESILMNEFLNIIRVNVLCEENAYLLNELLIDWINLCDERAIETTIYYTWQLRKRLETQFIEEIAFFPSGRNIIVHSASTNPCLYSTATLKGSGLRDTDITKGFACMVKRKISKAKKCSGNEFPCTPESLLDQLDEGPLKELYNVIYLTIRPTCNTNNYGYAITNSTNLATKIWSLANDWESLITGIKNAKQITLGMTIHRTSGSKDIANLLNKTNHAISYNDIRMQNLAWERMVMTGTANSTSIKRGKHSS